jgi:hypothetical protein
MSQNQDTFVIRDRRPGYLRVYNDLYDKFGAQLGPYGLAVYVALCRYANQDSECWPSYNTIATGTGMSRRQVIREVAKLEQFQILAVERNQHTSNVFILLDTSAQHAPPSDSQSPPPVTHSHPPSDSQSPKQSPINKITHRGMNKKKDASKRNYRPDEYADIILG